MMKVTFNGSTNTLSYDEWESTSILSSKKVNVPVNVNELPYNSPYMEME